jgi:peroxiredoxin (alkyl hydroperoxide reductase subunit C)
MSDIRNVTVGIEVPNFEIEVYNPEQREFSKVSLAELKAQKKWTVLVFYPADFTFVCPTELADLAEKHEALKKLGAEVISVSTDTKYTHMAWRDAEKLLSGVKYLMGADPTRALSHLFGVYDPVSGLSLRATRRRGSTSRGACRGAAGRAHTAPPASRCFAALWSRRRSR